MKLIEVLFYPFSSKRERSVRVIAHLTKYLPQAGRTEKIRNNLNPVFGTGVEIPYVFERQTFCKVVVIDDDSDGLSNDADNLGEAEFTLGQVKL